MPLPQFKDPNELALFLDFDGTLVAIADRPQDVRVQPDTLRALTALNELLGGAVAIVTGRDIETIDTFLAPLKLPVAGVHGATRRDFTGSVHSVHDDGRLAATVERLAAPLIALHPRLLLERKHGSIALHYRAEPDMEGACLELMRSAVDSVDDAVLKRGKMVVEAKAHAGDKGSAIADFMCEAPFAGRVPVFAGDDLTDEDAFPKVNALGGATIKVGPGETVASWRAADTDAFLAWLEELATALAGSASGMEC